MTIDPSAHHATRSARRTAAPPSKRRSWRPWPSPPTRSSRAATRDPRRDEGRQRRAAAPGNPGTGTRRPGGRQGTVGARPRPAVAGPGRPAPAGRAWGAAAPYADTDPEAASALRRAEERLRVLHPYAMARYDRLRAEGAAPAGGDAGGRAPVRLAPYARPGQPGAPRPAVDGRHPGRRVPPPAPGPRVLPSRRSPHGR